MPVTSAGHQLLDLGGAARLERFGERVIDRPSAAALMSRAEPERWATADLRFERDRGWRGPAATVGPWPIEIDGLALELRATDAGQVGLFPEHAAMLPWLRTEVGRRAGEAVPTVLHLFAYTGLATLAMAAAGATVTHLDSSRPTVTWARHNAESSGLADKPIRWIVDDALGFTRREVRRGRRYDGVVLDPPTYGHGPSNGDWRIEEHLPDLLAVIDDVLEPGGFLLLTAHTPGFDADRLAHLVRDALRRGSAAVDRGGLGLATDDGRWLDLGSFARTSGRS